MSNKHDLPPLPPTEGFLDQTLGGFPAFTAEQMRDYALAAIQRLEAENANLRSVMVAAAEEISAHWAAHCDDEGYGPANLMRRLEEGIPTEYAYTAGDFARLKAENQHAQASAEKMEKALRICRDTIPHVGGNYASITALRVVIDAAMTKGEA